MIRTGCPTFTLAMSTSLRLTLMSSDFKSATVNITVPSLKEETPEVTLSPSSTPLVITNFTIDSPSMSRAVATEIGPSPAISQ